MRVQLSRRVSPFGLLFATVLISGCPGDTGTGGTVGPSEAIVSTNPADGATGVSTDQVVTITFSLAAVADSLDGRIEPAIEFTDDWSADGTTLTIAPGGVLGQGVEYTVTITSVRFANGDRLEGPFSFRFTTSDGSDPGGGGSGGGSGKMGLWTVGQTRLRGAVVHPCTVASDADAEMTCDQELARRDLDDLKNLGANLIQASYPGLFDQRPPYGVNATAEAYLDSLVAWAAEVDLFVVIAVRTGPGRNEAQITGFGEPLATIWTEQAAHDAWVAMWRYMADRYRDNPVVAGYDIMVEPHVNTIADRGGNLSPTEFQRQNAGTLADWNAFAAEMTTAIREVDSDTPIIVSSLQWGNAEWFTALEPTGDARTVYTLHAYDPDVYTHQDTPDAAIGYPSVVENEGQNVTLDKTWLANSFAPAVAFSQTHDVPIYVGEYGAIRWLPGASAFVTDQVDLFETNGWNYTYYVWRGNEPTFNGFDMELGTDANSAAPTAGNPILSAHSARWSENSATPSTFSAPDPADPSARMTLPEVRTWAYQIQRLEDDRAIDMIDELVESRYDLLVLEPTRSDRDNTDFDTAGMVRRLHESPADPPDRTKLVIAYVDIGQAEDWRTYWGDDWIAPTASARGSPDFLITIDPDGWSGNYPVAFWDDRWKDIMIRGENSVLQQVLDDGFDGIYMDWVEAYSDATVMAAATGSALDPSREMVDFIREIREYAQARSPGFLVIPQNAAEILETGGQEYLDIIDGIAQEQIYFDGNADTEWDDVNAGDHRVPDTCPADDADCGYSRAFYEGWLKQYLAAGKPVLSVDYAADPGNVAEAYERASANGYIPYVSHRPLDRLTDTPPPELE